MRIGRYQVFREFARGGMAAVHLGRLLSDHGVGRLVAIKRLHRHFAADVEFAKMFLDEARLAARIHHPNVVSTLDLVSDRDKLYMILEYVEGETLSRLLFDAPRSECPIPDRIVSSLMTGALRGLHAAHEAKTPSGEPLGIVHRDFTPQNVLVGVDGVARVADFGIAKAAVRLQTTREGQFKGKLGYSAPEQLGASAVVDRRTDLFSAGVMLWELLVRRRLFEGESEAQVLMKILRGATDPPSDHAPSLDRAWDPIVERALALSPENRFQTAREMAAAIEAAFPPATPTEVGEWVTERAAPALAERAAWVKEAESAPVFETSPLVAPHDDSSPKEMMVDETTIRLASSPPRRRPVGWWVLASVVAGGALAWVVVRVQATPSDVRAEPERAPAVLAVPDGSDDSTPLPTAAPSSGVASVTAVEAAPALSVDTGPPPSLGKPASKAFPKKPPPSSPPATCRYFDEKEKIWKFRVECYE